MMSLLLAVCTLKLLRMCGLLSLSHCYISAVEWGFRRGQQVSLRWLEKHRIATYTAYAWLAVISVILLIVFLVFRYRHSVRLSVVNWSMVKPSVTTVTIEASYSV